MADFIPEGWIDSREVLAETRVSRATLNNYIKAGVLPNPVVGKPRSPSGTTKKIGYFPYGVLERIELIKVLKQEGNSIEEISAKLRDIPIRGAPSEHDLSGKKTQTRTNVGVGEDEELKNEFLSLTMRGIRLPAYLTDFNFQIKWINEGAVHEIFGFDTGLLKKGAARNIFELFFHWEFHSRVRNWQDIMAFHMSLAKVKFSRSWMGNLYKEISRREVEILEEIYDRVKPFPKQTVKDTRVNLLMEDGTTKSLKAYTIFFEEGILFVYDRIGFLD
jgi:DNA-binding transcriptional MerR regulator